MKKLVAAGLMALIISPAFATWTATELYSSDMEIAGGSGNCFCGTQYLTGIGSHAFYYSGTSLADLNPSGFTFSLANACTASAAVGYGLGTPTGDNYHPLLWASGQAVQDLTPTAKGYMSGQALGVYSQTQVGCVSKGSSPTAGELPCYWEGSSTLFALLPSLAGIESGSATAVASTGIVGWADTATTTGQDPRAVYWPLPLGKVIDLSDGSRSMALGVNGNCQVGVSNSHPALWSGTAASLVDLLPSGYKNGTCYGVFGNYQVGEVDNGYPPHAAFWNGTAASYFNLESVLPSSLKYGSAATAVTSYGNYFYIYGYAYDVNGAYHPVRWSQPGTVAAMPAPEERLVAFARSFL